MYNSARCHWSTVNDVKDWPLWHGTDGAASARGGRRCGAVRAVGARGAWPAARRRQRRLGRRPHRARPGHPRPQPPRGRRAPPRAHAAKRPQRCDLRVDRRAVVLRSSPRVGADVVGAHDSKTGAADDSQQLLAHPTVWRLQLRQSREKRQRDTTARDYPSWLRT